MDSKTLSPEEWEQKKKQFKYLLLQRGMQQKTIAKEIGVTEKTLSKWKKEMDIGKQWERVYDKDKIDTLHENTPGFIAYLKLKFPDLYYPVTNAYKQFLKPY